MFDVSQKYMDDMRAPVRTVLGRVRIDYTDPELDQSVIVSTSENNNVSYPQQVSDGITEAFGPVLSLDGSWTLGDGKVLAPAPDEIQYRQIGWWGSSLSGGQGDFTIAPTLTIEFDPRPIRDLRLVGYFTEYPVNFSIKLYSFDTVIHTETVIGNTLVDWSKDIDDIQDVNKMLITITKWSHPGRVVKITEAITSIQEIYEGEDIISINIIEERESTNNELPIGSIVSNEVEIELNNITRKFDLGNTKSPLKGLLKPNRRITIEIGTETEMVPMGTFWSARWDVPDDKTVAKVIGKDRISAMEEETFERVAPISGYQSLGHFAEEVFASINIGPDKYYIGPALYSAMTDKRVIEKRDIKTVFRWIAQAGLAQVFSDRNGVIRIESILNASESTSEVAAYLQAQFPAEININQAYGISPEDYFTMKPIVNRKDMANVVEITRTDGTVYTRKDTRSIELYGEIKYAINKNPLLGIIEGFVASVILDRFNEPMDSVEISWRGNPALELGDLLLLSTYKRDPDTKKEYYSITKQTFEYAGYLRSKLTGRRVT